RGSASRPRTARASTSTRCARRSTGSSTASTRRAVSSDKAMAEDLYREVILDHYKNPRGHGVIEDADAQAEGVNPLCGDEISIYVQFGEDGETVDEVKFSGRGCAISQASTSMLMEMVKGKTARE